MSYITQDNLIDRFSERELIQLTDRTNTPASSIDGDVVNAAIADATALVDSYLAKRYALPLSDVPSVLTRMAGDIARYYLHGSRADKDHPVTVNYRDAVAWLDKVAKGTVQLEADGIDAEQAGDGEVRTSGPDRTFTRDSMAGY